MEELHKFEDAMAELETVVRKLETGEGSLDEMLAYYERGMFLVKACNERLDAYEARITKLTQAGEEALDDC